MAIYTYIVVLTVIVQLFCYLVKECGQAAILHKFIYKHGRTQAISH